MFDVGFSELLVIGVIALMVVGPERLPKLARQAGFWVGRARRMVTDVKADIDREINRADLSEDFKDVKNVIHETKSQIEAATTNVADTITKQTTDMKKDVDDLAADATADLNDAVGADSASATSSAATTDKADSMAATSSTDGANKTSSTS